MLNAFKIGSETYPESHEWVFGVVEMLPIFIIYLAFSIVYPGECLAPPSTRLDLESYELSSRDGLRCGIHDIPHSAPLPNSVLSKPLPSLPGEISPITYAASRGTRPLRTSTLECPDPSSKRMKVLSEVSPYESKQSYRAFMSGGL